MTDVHYTTELNQLRARIINEFSPMWEVNDPAHRQEHFTDVENCGNFINQKLTLGYDPKLIMFVAWFHDLFTWDRSNHHLMSAHWIMTTENPIINELGEGWDLVVRRNMVAEACREHRASYNGDYSTRFSELMACADRGFPGNVTDMMNRAINYRLHRGYLHKDAIEGAYVHLKEKFGKGGYARYPSMYLEVFDNELQKQRSDIDNL